MSLRATLALLSSILLSTCANNPTPVRLTGTVSPNPLPVPAAAGDVSWDLELLAYGSGSVLLERGDVQLLAASGAKVGQTLEYWSPTNCSVCTREVRIAPGTPQRWSGKRIHYIGGEAPVRFVYTLSYVDDLGPGTLSIEVPVR
jgi:hypothetical protein